MTENYAILTKSFAVTIGEWDLPSFMLTYFIYVVVEKV